MCHVSFAKAVQTFWDVAIAALLKKKRIIFDVMRNVTWTIEFL